MDTSNRTTVTIPTQTHQKLQEIAQHRGYSIGFTLKDIINETHHSIFSTHATTTPAPLGVEIPIEPAKEISYRPLNSYVQVRPEVIDYLEVTKAIQNRYRGLRRIWNNLLDLCYSYPDYLMVRGMSAYFQGFRVRVCNEWLELSSFIDYALQTKDQIKMTLKTRNPHEDFSPATCVWIPSKERQRYLRTLPYYNSDTTFPEYLFLSRTITLDALIHYLQLHYTYDRPTSIRLIAYYLLRDYAGLWVEDDDLRDDQLITNWVLYTTRQLKYLLSLSPSKPDWSPEKMALMEVSSDEKSSRLVYPYYCSSAYPGEKQDQFSNKKILTEYDIYLMLKAKDSFNYSDDEKEYIYPGKYATYVAEITKKLTIRFKNNTSTLSPSLRAIHRPE